ncbi:Tetratricopeptide repeat protein 29, partial [Borealophlyctis nickersoniae]
MCLDLLVAGHVRSYIDFFHMVVEPARTAPSPYSPKVLNDFKKLLTAAEDSQRKGDSTAIYQTRKHLASYFQDLGNDEVAAGYYREALDIASLISGDRTWEVEGARNLGTVLESSGKSAEALEYYEQSRKLARLTKNQEAENLASKAIVNVRMNVAEQLEDEGKYQEAISHYTECIEVLESGSSDAQLLNDVHYRLGKAYKQIGDIETAIKYLEAFLEKAKSFGDKTKEGFAQAALASCYE